MAEETIQISYSGPALEEGTMDVRELAPALLALGKLCEESNRVINEDRATVRVRVIANFRTGSFEIDFQLIQSISEQVSSLFKSESIKNANDLLKFLGLAGGVGTGLWQLLKRLKGRTPKKITELKDGNVVLEYDDGNTSAKITVPTEVIKLSQDYRVREEMNNVVNPLRREGIETVKFQDDEKASVSKQEVDFFKVPYVAEQDEVIYDRKTEQVFSIAALSFKEENKWRLSDGTNTFLVDMEDQVFLDKINNNDESFAKGDQLKVKLQVVQYRKPNGNLRTDYKVFEVMEHHLAGVKPRQIQLIDEID